MGSFGFLDQILFAIIRSCITLSDMMKPYRTKTRNMPRAFVRDGALTIRMPSTFKTKLTWLAGVATRDTSNLGLELLQQGAERFEAYLREQGKI